MDKFVKGEMVVTTVDGYKDVLICSPNMLIGGGFDDGNKTATGT